MKTEKSIKVNFKGKLADLITFSKIKEVTTASKFNSKIKTSVFETMLFIDGVYKMHVSCGIITGKSKKAEINRISLKNQYNIELV